MLGLIQYELPMIAFEFICSAVPFLIFLLVIRLLGKKRMRHAGVEKQARGGRERVRVRAAWVYFFVFMVYVTGVFHYTGAGTLWEPLRYGGVDLSTQELNLIPFSRGIDVTGYALNVVLFLPFGVLAPFLWKNMEKFRNVLAGGFIFSLLIELSQLLNNRSTDVDDLILNTAGALIGYAIYGIVASFLPEAAKAAGRIKTNPALVITVMFLGRFLLFDEMWVALELFRY